MENLKFVDKATEISPQFKICKRRRPHNERKLFKELINKYSEKILGRSHGKNCEQSTVAKIDVKKRNAEVIEDFRKNYHLKKLRLLSKSNPSFFLHHPKISPAFSPEFLDLIPDIEPEMPIGGWKYKLIEPCIPPSLIDNVVSALSTKSISTFGPWPQKMSEKLKKIFGRPVAQPCSSGFTALMLALQAANIKESDEVIIPSFTFIAVANAVHFVRAIPIFADSSKENYNPSWENIEQVSTVKTKAIIITHTYGVPAPDIERISNECLSRGWCLIEDISQCVGVKGKSARLLGTYGDFTCASLFLSKMIHGGDGGFVLAKNDQHENRLASLVNHGFIAGIYYVHIEPSINGKINALGAAMACACLDELDNVIANRIPVARKYREFLKRVEDARQISLMPLCGPMDTPWVFGVHCESKIQRMMLRKMLANNSIETRDFFFPIHLQPAYSSLRSRMNCTPLPNAEKFGNLGFYLPTHYNVKEIDQEFICSIIGNFFTQTVENFK